jgi:hypothetical protein
MSRKSINFQPPAARATRSAALPAQHSAAPLEVWVTETPDETVDPIAPSPLQIVEQPLPDATRASAEAALRIARMAPLWLAWYHYAGAVTEILRGPR